MQMIHVGLLKTSVFKPKQITDINTRDDKYIPLKRKVRKHRQFILEVVKDVPKKEGKNVSVFFIDIPPTPGSALRELPILMRATFTINIQQDYHVRSCLNKPKQNVFAAGATVVGCWQRFGQQ